MKRIVLCIAFIMYLIPASTATAHDGGLVPQKAATITTIKKDLYKNLNKTHLRSRIVMVRIKKRNKEIKVYLTWHPYKEGDVAKDTYVIVKIVNKIIPNFHSISLKAIEPESLRWTKRIFWRNVITKRDLNFIEDQANNNSDKPRPLFY